MTGLQPLSTPQTKQLVGGQSTGPLLADTPSNFMSGVEHNQLRQPGQPQQQDSRQLSVNRLCGEGDQSCVPYSHPFQMSAGGLN